MANKIDFLNQIISFCPDYFAQEVKQYVACQFALESAFGQSAFATIDNNYCGMKVPKFRITLALNYSECDKFARYSGIFTCFQDYLLWLQYNRFTRYELQDKNLFVRHLNLSRYCPDLGYFDRIDSIFNQYYSSKK